MKIALYIEDGLEQIVLTPEGDTEKAILSKLTDGTRTLQILKGSFFKVRGGWMRHGIYSPPRYGPYGEEAAQEDSSTMIVLTQSAADQPIA